MIPPARIRPPAPALRFLVPLLALLWAGLPAPARADGPPSCDGPFNGREVPAPALATVMAAHRAWLGDYRGVLLDSIHAMSQFRDVVATMDSAAYLRALADPRRADLCGARLAGIDLGGADLVGVDLTGADLAGTDLGGADLTGVDLTGADLTGAGLAGTNLTGADVTGTRLARANLFGTVFEPRLSGLDQFREGPVQDVPQPSAGHHPIGFPDMDAMARARNLDRMVFATSPTPLQRLKDAFAARGHRAAARQVMASLQWADDLRLVRDGAPADRVGGALRVVMLGITCSYGASPGRALGWLLCLVLAFAIPYARMIAHQADGPGAGGPGAGAPPSGVLTYALSGAGAGLGLALLAPWLVLNPGPAWLSHLGPAGTAGAGAWAAMLLLGVPFAYGACVLLLAGAVAIRAWARRGRPATSWTLLISGVLVAGLVSIPSLALATGPAGQPSAFGGPMAFVAVWVLLLLALMHTAGTYARGRDGAILARWESEHEARPGGRIAPEFFRPHGSEGTAPDTAPGPDRLAPLYVVKGALWFSLIISCRIGWKDLSLGTWLTHIQPRPYSLVPTGGLRVICGFQSIIGSYLLALLLLTYFRPLFSL